MSEFDVTDQQPSRATRRAVVATGVKVAYAAPILAASFKLSASNAFAVTAISGGVCLNGGCQAACIAGATAHHCNNPVEACSNICGNNVAPGACPGGSSCCNPGYCDPGNYTCSNTTNGVRYNGPSTGCPPTTSTTKKKK